VRCWGGCEWSLLLRPWEDGGVLQVKARRGRVCLAGKRENGEEGGYWSLTLGLTETFLLKNV
jgi:hypothetical protein